MIASHLEIKIEDKQTILETLDQKERLGKLNEILLKEIEILRSSRTSPQRSRPRSIRTRGNTTCASSCAPSRRNWAASRNWRTRSPDSRRNWRNWIWKRRPGEGRKGDQTDSPRCRHHSAEATVSSNYIETVLELPWNTMSEDNIDLVKAERILNEDHYGLEKVKERVLEYLAVMQLSEGLKGPILCLVGPPGTGKTSIARSVARSIGREFVRMSLGGVRDEAEIRGHRRTYIGAIPGRIITNIKDCGVNNPVFLFDEVDKIGADYKGDPASALLEVLDPEQNKDFTDHYLEVPFDLSKVMFITTANTTETIPRPLLDRMEVIEVSGYTEEDKLKIARHYLVPKQIKENGLTKDNISFTKAGIKTIINYYTRESGVRNLEREIGTLCSKVARKIRDRRHREGQRDRRKGGRIPGQEEVPVRYHQRQEGSRRDHRTGMDHRRRRYSVHRDRGGSRNRQAGADRTAG